MIDRAYIFTSELLGFREWLEDDVEQMCTINADPEAVAFKLISSVEEIRTPSPAQSHRKSPLYSALLHAW